MSIDVKGFENVFKSLRLYNKIAAGKLDMDHNGNENKLLEILYIDLLPNNGVMKKILDERTTFLIGKRGTGKSTIFARAQYEISKKKENLCVYINANSIYKDVEINNSNNQFEGLDNVFTREELFRLSLISNVISALQESLLEELKKEEYDFFERIQNYFRNKSLRNCLDKLKNIIDAPELKEISKVIINNNKTASSDEIVAEIKAALKNFNVGGSVRATEKNSEECQNINVLARCFNISGIINKLKEIIEICKRKALFIFIDDYSELDKKSRLAFMETIINPFYHVGLEKIHLKIAAYPNKVEPITLMSGKYDRVPIDMFHIYGKDNNITDTEKKAIEYTSRLVKNRINYYCSSTVEEYFDTASTNMDDYYRLLFYASMNTPRTLGHILNECYINNIVYSKPINRSTILDASKQYYLDEVESYFASRKETKANNNDDTKLDVFVEENLLKSLVQYAQKNRYELTKMGNSYFKGLSSVNTSHFTISHEFEQYLDNLEFNGFIHKINQIASKGRGQIGLKNDDNFLYCFDFGLCQYEKILFSKPEGKDTKFYQQRAFQYDATILLSLRENKKIVCKSCKKVSSIEELDMFKKFRMKCTECDDGTCAIEFNRELQDTAVEYLSKAIWTEAEFDILHAIKKLERILPGEKITANLISRETDHHSNSIAKKCKKLAELDYVSRGTTENPYTYSLTVSSRKILNEILTKGN